MVHKIQYTGGLPTFLKIIASTSDELHKDIKVAVEEGKKREKMR